MVVKVLLIVVVLTVKTQNQLPFETRRTTFKAVILLQRLTRPTNPGNSMLLKLGKLQHLRFKTKLCSQCLDSHTALEKEDEICENKAVFRINDRKRSQNKVITNALQ